MERGQVLVWVLALWLSSCAQQGCIARAAAVLRGSQLMQQHYAVAAAPDPLANVQQLAEGLYLRNNLSTVDQYCVKEVVVHVSRALQTQASMASSIAHQRWSLRRRALHAPRIEPACSIHSRVCSHLSWMRLPRCICLIWTPQLQCQLRPHWPNHAAFIPCF